MKTYIKRIKSDRGDFIVKLCFEEVSPEIEASIIDNSMDNILLSLIINSKRDYQITNGELSWIKFEDYVYYITKTGIKSPIEVETDLFNSGYFPSSDYTEDFLKFMTDIPLDIIVIKNMTINSAKQQKHGIEELTRLMEEAQASYDYETAAVYKQQIAIIENSENTVTHERQEDRVQWNKEEPIAKDSLTLTEKQSLINELTRLMEEAQASFDYETAAVYKRRILLLEETVDFEENQTHKIK